jgi:hypothetical protein
MIDETELILEIAKSPTEYLTDKSLDALHAFLMGVDAGLAAHGKGPLVSGVDQQFLRDWFYRNLLVAEEHASRMNAFNCMSPSAFCELMCDGEQDAFELYIKTRKEAFLASPNPKDKSDDGFRMSKKSFFEFIEFVKKRPGMYVTNWDILAYDNMARGFVYAEEIILGISSDLKIELEAFKEWLDQRYPYGVGRPFSKVIKFTSTGQRHTDIEYFEEHLDMFRGNESPDASDRTQELMIKNILKHTKNLEE